MGRHLGAPSPYPPPSCLELLFPLFGDKRDVHHPHFQPQSPAPFRRSDWPRPSLCLACPLNRRRENLEIGQETRVFN